MTLQITYPQPIQEDALAPAALSLPGTVSEFSREFYTSSTADFYPARLFSFLFFFLFNKTRNPLAPHALSATLSRAQLLLLGRCDS